MTQQGGDRAFGHGDEITVVNNNGSEISDGQLVYVDGYDGDYPTVSLADDTTGYDGVVADTGADGEKLKVVFHGTPWVRVSSSVTAGSSPAGSTTAGSATDGGSGDDVYLTDAETLQDGNDYAVVHIK